ncbi:MAG: hypothetical protein ACO1N3_02970 [Gammaproteobacteria bacterium]
MLSYLRFLQRSPEAHMAMLDAIIPPDYLTDFVLWETAARAKRHGHDLFWEPPATYKP